MNSSICYASNIASLACALDLPIAVLMRPIPLDSLPDGWRNTTEKQQTYRIPNTGLSRNKGYSQDSQDRLPVTGTGAAPQRGGAGSLNGRPVQTGANGMPCQGSDAL